METLSNIVDSLNGVLSNYVLIIALLGGGIWFSFNLGFIQVSGFGEGMRRTFGGLFHKSGEANEDGMTAFQALATAIAAQVGTGNIAGAATAIAVGGAGAIFWMWIAAFLGMSTIYAEAVLAQKFKVRGDDGEITGGPVYYIKAAFSGGLGKILAGAFSVFIILALGFIGNAVQSNSIADAFYTAFKVPQPIMGGIIAVLGFIVFIGGTKRIAKVTETIVPFMAGLYILGSLILIFAYYKDIPRVFHDIFAGAFNPQAVYGGAFGATIKVALTKGVARGLFSNEAGMGSTPHAHAVAKVKHPVEQGFVAMTGVFIDTFIVLNVTAFVILATTDLAANQGLTLIPGQEEALTGAALTQHAFSQLYGGYGPKFIAICMLFFAFSTIIGWYFFGQANIKYLFGSKAVKIYGILVCVCVFLGSLTKVTLIWNMADLFNSLMVVPNVIGLFALTGVVKQLTKEFKDEK